MQQTNDSFKPFQIMATLALFSKSISVSCFNWPQHRLESAKCTGVLAVMGNVSAAEVKHALPTEFSASLVGYCRYSCSKHDLSWIRTRETVHLKPNRLLLYVARGACAMKALRGCVKDRMYQMTVTRGRVRYSRRRSGLCNDTKDFTIVTSVVYVFYDSILE